MLGLHGAVGCPERLERLGGYKWWENAIAGGFMCLALHWKAQIPTICLLHYYQPQRCW